MEQQGQVAVVEPASPVKRFDVPERVVTVGDARLEALAGTTLGILYLSGVETLIEQLQAS